MNHNVLCLLEFNLSLDIEPDNQTRYLNPYQYKLAYCYGEYIGGGVQMTETCSTHGALRSVYSTVV